MTCPKWHERSSNHRRVTEFSKKPGQEDSDYYLVTKFVGYGKIRSIDVESGTVVLEWVDQDYEGRPPRSLSEAVKGWDGHFVKMCGSTTCDSNGQVVRLEFETIAGESPLIDQLQETPSSEPFVPKTVPRANFDFDVDEFLRGIYEARQGGACTRPDCDFNLSERLPKQARRNTEA